MKKQVFKSMEEAMQIMGLTGRVWTAVKVKGGIMARMNFGHGFRYVEEIDVYHIVNNGMYRAA